MRSFFRSVKFKIVISVLAALLLGVFIAAVSGSGQSPLTSVVNVVMTPLNKAAVKLSEKLSGFNAGFVSSSKYLEEINSLKKELEEYKEKLVDYENSSRSSRHMRNFSTSRANDPIFHSSRQP